MDLAKKIKELRESIGMVYVSYPGAVSKANVGISNDKEG